MKNPALRRLSVVIACVVLAVVSGCATAETKDVASDVDYGPAPKNYVDELKSRLEGSLFSPADYTFYPPKQFAFYAKTRPSPDMPSATRELHLYVGWVVRVKVVSKDRTGEQTVFTDRGFLYKDGRIIRTLDDGELRDLANQGLVAASF